MDMHHQWFVLLQPGQTIFVNLINERNDKKKIQQFVRPEFFN